MSDERLLDILEAILGPNVEFLSDKVVFKDTERHVASPWHQDWPYWEGTHKISVGVALDDATPENGCLKLLPGSHLGSVIHDGDRSDGSGFGHRIRPETVEESAAISAPVEAGGAVFFHDLTMHASHPNTERRERWTGSQPFAMRRAKTRPIRLPSPITWCAASAGSEHTRELCRRAFGH